MPLIWESGIYTLNLKIGFAPLIVPTAATSGQPWGKPGISPYASYFTQLSEYVSPGNGLLGISQTGLSLPGRGLNLTLTRIFSTRTLSIPREQTNHSRSIISHLAIWESVGSLASLGWGRIICICGTAKSMDTIGPETYSSITRERISSSTQIRTMTLTAFSMLQEQGTTSTRISSLLLSRMQQEITRSLLHTLTRKFQT